MKLVTTNESGEFMTSREIAEISGKPHSDLLKAIRAMEDAWEKVNGGKFTLVEYLDAKGEKRPQYMLSKTECLYIATKFNDEARAKLVLRWENLEKERKPLIPQSFSEALQLAADQAKAIEMQQKQIGNLKTALDVLVEWVSIIKVAQHNGVSEKLFDWRKLKDASQRMGFEVKKAQSPRYGYQNLYHVSAFKACYSELDYNFISE